MCRPPPRPRCRRPWWARRIRPVSLLARCSPQARLGAARHRRPLCSGHRHPLHAGCSPCGPPQHRCARALGKGAAAAQKPTATPRKEEKQESTVVIHCHARIVRQFDVLYGLRVARTTAGE
jgi:hypothetical protein